MEVLFFANSDCPALVIRAETRRPGQPWAQVPSHCALRFGADVYEFLWPGGWRMRRTDSRDTWALPVSAPFPERGHGFAMSCRGDRYDVPALFCSLIGLRLPAWCHLTDTQRAEYDCSRFVYTDLVASGCRDTLSDTPSPNDVLYYLKTLDLKSLGAAH